MPRISREPKPSKRPASKGANAKGLPKGADAPKGAKLEPRLSKFQRCRASKRAKGMKLLRIWVPDVHAPGFAEEAARQAELLRGRPEEREAMEFIERVFDWSEGAKRGDIVTIAMPGDDGKPRPAVVVQSDHIMTESLLVAQPRGASNPKSAWRVFLASRIPESAET